MGKKEFEEFLKKTEKRESPSKDWRKEKIKWFNNHLDTLYSDIQTWLNEYVEDGRIKLEFDNIEIYEEDLGAYDVKRLRLVLGRQTAELTPIGTMLIGTAGRADLSGRVKTIRFILADKKATGVKIISSGFLSEEEFHKYKEGEKNKPEPQIDWVWKITSNPPNIKYTELNQNSFFQCIKDVIDA